MKYDRLQKTNFGCVGNYKYRGVDFLREGSLDPSSRLFFAKRARPRKIKELVFVSDAKSKNR